ncbi:DUF2169 domain-containing protein [Polyangium sp. 6x1]|uniref:DUF2169 domain-containing protein n=1 Tax=Polyangium sp. 6x1 TaxID=3042689 RepID=UPI002483223B|nr:DUF2169 domain-containing protein [Polyangium sp. 6x1]MDI1451765.1 DUF2169 domain-containing protein [Polyangium sp. 6x1]
MCKATFWLQPGTSPLAEQQEAPFDVDLPWPDGAYGSLRFSTDRVPFKRHAEVLVGGHVYAPRGQPTTSLVARLSVGPLNKAIEVHGDRVWVPDGRLSEAAYFLKMPIRWERAAGGPGTWNPGGIPANPPPDARGVRPVPNLMPVGYVLRAAAQVMPPVGFGPVAPGWPERTAKLRRHVATWRQDTWASEPLPADMDAGFFNAAPSDQQLAQLGVGEQILLEHLHPEYPQLVTKLATVTPQALAQRPGGAAEEIRLRCDTMWIDTDRGTCALVWRGILGLKDPMEDGAVLVTCDHPGGNQDDGTRTRLAPATPMSERKRATMPFQSARRTLHLPPTPVGTTKGTSAGSSAPIQTETGTWTTFPGNRLAATTPLPFDPASAPIRLTEDDFEPEEIDEVEEICEVEEIGKIAADREDEAGTTLIAPLRAPGETPPALPFLELSPGVISALATGASEGNHSSIRLTDFGTGTLTPWHSPGPAPASALPFASPHREPPVAPEHVKESATLPPSLAKAPELPAPPVMLRTPETPPMIGPLATPEMIAGPNAQASKPTSGEVANESPAEGPTKAPTPVVKDIPLEQCAAISASMERRAQEREKILEENELSAEAWAAAAQRWEEAIDEEIERGGMDLLKRFDAAYVAQLEKERGVIQPEEYARLQVAAERGTTEKVLAELGIPEEAELRLERVWLERVMEDPGVGKRVQILGSGCR